MLLLPIELASTSPKIIGRSPSLVKDVYIDGQTGAPACNGAISYNDIVGICMSMPCTVTYVNTVSG